MASTKKCAKCRWNTIVGRVVVCDYLYKTGHCRPCPPGDECTVYTLARRKKAKNSAIDALT